MDLNGFSIYGGEGGSGPGPGPGVTLLSELEDVTISPNPPPNGSILEFNSTEGKWVNGSLSPGISGQMCNLPSITSDSPVQQGGPGTPPRHPTLYSGTVNFTSGGMVANPGTAYSVDPTQFANFVIPVTGNYAYNYNVISSLTSAGTAGSPPFVNSAYVAFQLFPGNFQSYPGSVTSLTLPPVAANGQFFQWDNSGIAQMTAGQIVTVIMSGQAAGTPNLYQIYSWSFTLAMVTNQLTPNQNTIDHNNILNNGGY